MVGGVIGLGLARGRFRRAHRPRQDQAEQDCFSSEAAGMARLGFGMSVKKDRRVTVHGAGVFAGFSSTLVSRRPARAEMISRPSRAWPLARTTQRTSLAAPPSLASSI